MKPEFWADRDGHWTGHFVTMAKHMSNGKTVQKKIPILPREYLENPTAWPKGNIDIYTTCGEYNSNGKIQAAQFACEPAVLIHGLAKRSDSGQNCPRADHFQPQESFFSALSS